MIDSVLVCPYHHRSQGPGQSKDACGLKREISASISQIGEVTALLSPATLTGMGSRRNSIEGAFG